MYGKAEGLFDEEEKMEVKDSAKIIRELMKVRDEENTAIINELVMKITLLKKGLDVEGQKQIMTFLEGNSTI